MSSRCWRRLGTFTVTAAGDSPLTYRWYFNTNTLLAGQTGTNLFLPSVTTNDMGTYTVVVTNLFGAATSSPALLTVTVTSTTKPSIVAQPQSLTTTNGYAAQFSMVASGSSPLYYQWYFNTNTVLTGETNNLLTLPSTTSGNAGYYTVSVTNSAGAVTSSPALLTVLLKPFITTQPQNLNVTNADTASFSVTATSVSPLTYQWFFNTNTLLASQTNSTLIIANVITNNAGTYSVVVANNVGSVTSSPAILTVASATKPIILLQPTDLTITNGTTATFFVSAVGQSALRYQWYSNTVITPVFTSRKLLAGKTNATLTFTATHIDLSFYTVIITNSLGSVTSSPSAMLTIISAPLITSNPIPATVFNGDPASFTVGATGAGILRFQWYFNTNTVLTNQLGNLISGKTNGTLNFAAVSNSLLGRYSVIVTNTFGRATSSPALLSLASGSPPSITLQPLSRTITNGDAVTFLSAANGTNPLSYQWFFNTNQFITGATNTALTFSNANLPGTYSMRVTNSFGAATSTPALLTVVGQPLMLTASFDSTSGSYTFSYVNLAGSTNRLWASTNLAATNFWKVIATNTMTTNGVSFFTDVNTAATNAARFYRFSTP
jgi:hypothetical protein